MKKLMGTELTKAARWDGESIWLETDRGTYRATPYGDCCANCYVQHVSGAEALAAGAVIIDVEDIELQNVKDESCDVSDVWGHRLRTSKGWCTIEMRVDHNGYYGGSLDVTPVGLAVPEAAKPLEDF
jgi:hypothetical protein